MVLATGTTTTMIESFSVLQRLSTHVSLTMLIVVVVVVVVDNDGSDYSKVVVVFVLTARDSGKPCQQYYYYYYVASFQLSLSQPRLSKQQDEDSCFEPEDRLKVLTDRMVSKWMLLLLLLLLLQMSILKIKIFHHFQATNWYTPE